MSFDPSMLHNNGHTAYANGSGPGIRETGVVEKLLTSYGFIQCSERQARLFFHCSQYNGNLQELKIGGEELDSITHSNIAFLDLKMKACGFVIHNNGVLPCQNYVSLYPKEPFKLEFSNQPLYQLLYFEKYF